MRLSEFRVLAAAVGLVLVLLVRAAFPAPRVREVVLELDVDEIADTVAEAGGGGAADADTSDVEDPQVAPDAVAEAQLELAAAANDDEQDELAAAAAGGGATQTQRREAASGRRRQPVARRVARRALPVLGAGATSGAPDAPSGLSVRYRAACSGHGARQGAQGCRCATLYGGTLCERAVRVAGLPGLAPGYAEDVVLTRKMLDGLDGIGVPGLPPIVPRLSAVLRQTLAGMLPDADPLALRQFNTCAVVGFGGTVLREENGFLIDAAEAVFRFNTAPTVGYERYVGSRTTVRVADADALGFREFADEIVVHLLRSKAFIVKLFGYEKRFPGRAPLLLSPAFMEYAANSTDDVPLSSSWVGTLLAMQLCGQVRLYGFHAPILEGARQHYYDADAPQQGQGDAADELAAEFNTLLRLHGAGMLKFGERCVAECATATEQCRECVFEHYTMELEHEASRERWTPAMKQANAKRNAQWASFSRWQDEIAKRYEWDDARGLTRKLGSARRSASPRGSRACSS